MVCSMATKIANQIHANGSFLNQHRRVGGERSPEMAKLVEGVECPDKQRQIIFEHQLELSRNGGGANLHGKTLDEIHGFFAKTGVLTNCINASFRVHMGGVHGTMHKLNIINPELYKQIRGEHGDMYRKFGIEMQWGLGGQIGISANTPENAEGHRRMASFFGHELSDWHATGQCNCCQPGDWTWNSNVQQWIRNPQTQRA